MKIIFKLGCIMRSENYNTRQKDMILNAIKESNHEFTIKDIYNALEEKIGLTTIYRFIDKLVSDGTVSKSIGINNITYYQYLGKCCHENHFFLKCEKCGFMEHVDCDCISSLTDHILTNHKFTPKRDQIIINGICESCMKEEKNEKV